VETVILYRDKFVGEMLAGDTNRTNELGTRPQELETA